MRGWVFALCHQLRVTLPPLALALAPAPLLLLVLLPLLLHAAIVTAAATAIAMMAGLLEPRMGSSPDDAGDLLISVSADRDASWKCRRGGRASRAAFLRPASSKL
jgi:hypothetical protein